MDGFKKYLKDLGLCDKSIKDDMSRINMMKSRNIDFTKGEANAKDILLKSDLSSSSIQSCLRLCRRYKDYIKEKLP